MTSEPPRILAIDPGMSGGLVWSPAPHDPGEPYVSKMPETEGDITTLLKSTRIELAYIEDVPWIVAGPKQNAASRAKLHRNVGFLHGALSALGVRVIKVAPKDWQSALHLGARGDRDQTQWKNHLKAEAQRRFPKIAVTLATADALLIWEYARLQERQP